MDESSPMDAPSWPPAKPCTKSAVHGILTSAWAMYLLELRRGGTSGPPRSEEVQALWPELHEELGTHHKIPRRHTQSTPRAGEGLQPLTPPTTPYSSYTPLGCCNPSHPLTPLTPLTTP